MAEREWKPGDVALVRTDNGHERVMVRGTFNHLWVDQVGKFEDHLVKSARPLVVIDPEDREQVERFARHIYPHVPSPVVDDFMVACREYANPTPPKPEEPTGLGAVVEDADGSVMVRTNSKPDLPWTCAGTGSIWHWEAIDAVRVLSEGVQP